MTFFVDAPRLHLSNVFDLFSAWSQRPFHWMYNIHSRKRYLPRIPTWQLNPKQRTPFDSELLSVEGLSNEITNQISKHFEIELRFNAANDTWFRFHSGAEKLLFCETRETE